MPIIFEKDLKEGLQFYQHQEASHTEILSSISSQGLLPASQLSEIKPIVCAELEALRAVSLHGIDFTSLTQSEKKLVLERIMFDGRVGFINMSIERKAFSLCDKPQAYILEAQQRLVNSLIFVCNYPSATSRKPFNPPITGVSELSTANVPSQEIVAIITPQGMMSTLVKRHFPNVNIVEAPMILGDLSLSSFTRATFRLGKVERDKFMENNDSIRVFVPDYILALQSVIQSKNLVRFATHLTRLATIGDILRPKAAAPSKQVKDAKEKIAIVAALTASVDNCRFTPVLSQPVLHLHAPSSVSADEVPAKLAELKNFIATYPIDKINDKAACNIFLEQADKFHIDTKNKAYRLLLSDLSIIQSSILKKIGEYDHAKLCANESIAARKAFGDTKERIEQAVINSVSIAMEQHSKAASSSASKAVA